MTYLRFVITKRDEDSGRAQGLFQAAYDLLDSGDLDPVEHATVRSAMDWFRKHLQAQEAVDTRAIFWFKAESVETVQRMWTLIGVLREHGLHVRMMKTDEPGTTDYDDSHQIAAIPCKHTPR